VSCFVLSWSDFFYALILKRIKAVAAPVGIVDFAQYEGCEWGRSSQVAPSRCCRSSRGCAAT
jgi:hypothetical protein